MAEIRLAQLPDVEALLALGKQMYSEGPNFLKLDFSVDKARRVIENLIDQGGVIVACKEGQIVGVLGFAVFEHLWGHDKVAADVGIYIHPAHRVGSTFMRLIRAFERYGAERGAKILELGTSAGVQNERIAETFVALGYYRNGIGVRKEISHVHR